MKYIFLPLVFIVLAGVSKLCAQAEPTPVPTPNDVPAAQATPETKPAGTDAACPGCGVMGTAPSPTPTATKADPPAAASPEGVTGVDHPPGAVTTPTSAPELAENAEATLARLEQDWGDAIMRHDVEFLERTEADGYTYTGPDGIVSHKADEIAGAKAALANIESFTHREIKVQVYGETAVVTGATTLKGKAGDIDLGGDFRWTDVFVRKNGAWQVVASQATPINKNAAAADQ